LRRVARLLFCLGGRVISDKLSRFDAWLFAGWVLVTLGAFIAFAFPGLVFLLIFVGVGILLAQLPFLWFYTGIPGALYLGLRLAATSWSLAAAIGLGSMLAIYAAGSHFAAAGREATLTQAESLVAEDIEGPVALDPVETFLDLRRDIDVADRAYLECSDTCQRVLFSGLATRFAIGEAAHFDPANPEQAALIVHEIVPLDEGCDENWLDGVRARKEDFAHIADRRFLYLSAALVDLEFDDGLCLRSTPADRVRADVIKVESGPGIAAGFSSQARWDFRLERLDTWARTELYVAGGDALDRRFRETSVRYALVSKPLSPRAPYKWNTFTPGGWVAGTRQEGEWWVPLDALIAHDFAIGNR